MKKRGRQLLLGKELDDNIKDYVFAIRENGGVITMAITLAAATAIVREVDRNLAENGGPIMLTKKLGQVSY